MIEIDHLSYSSISHYLYCPRSWYFHYIEKVESRPSAALVVGSAFHETVEAALLIDDPTLIDIWQNKWNLQLEKNNELGIDWGISTEEAEYNTGIRMLTSDTVLDTIKGIIPLVGGEGLTHYYHIEDRIELQVPGVPVPVIGYIDVITEDGIPGDFKTAARMWYESKAWEELQPTFYLAALNQAGYEGNPEQKFKHYIFTKAKKPKARVFETSRSIKEQLWLMTLIGDVWRSIEKEMFHPNPLGWKCNPKYCDFWHLCRGK